MTTRPPPGADPLADAIEHCAALARAHARDQWLGALYASEEARGALFALASFDYEIRHALKRARDPNLAAIRLAWWREAIAGERPAEAAGNPVALALRAAIDAYALPQAWLDAMLDARLHGDRAAGRFQPRGFSRVRRRERGRAPAARVAHRGGRTGSRSGGRRMRLPAWRWR